MRMIVKLSLLACTVVLGACSDRSPAGPQSSLPELSYANVAYGADPLQVMDVRLPAGRGAATPVVMFVHGGGWSGGDKSVFTPTDLQKFIARGYACVNINYRLAGAPLNLHDPVMSNDVTAALDFVAAHASDYQVASATFAMVGHSAGAHLSLLAAYKFNSSGRIKAVASLSGPTDLTEAALLAVPTIKETIEQYLGVTLAAAPSRWTGASPVSVVTAQAPPTILLQGKVDALVPYSQAASLHARLTALGVHDEYDLFPTYNHDLGYTALNHMPDDVWNPTLAWFAKYLK